MTEAKKLPYINGLDGLRAIAVLLVVWQHLPYFGLGHFVAVMRDIVKPGYFGVDIFFVLSGFLITRILIHSKQNGHSIWNFYIRRGLRIYPIYYLLLSLYLIFDKGSWTYIKWCAVYLSNILSVFETIPFPLKLTWSLCVEEHFYFIWPILIFITPRKYYPHLCIGFIAAAISAAFGVSFLRDRGYVYIGTPFRMGSLSLGSLIALYEDKICAKRALNLNICIYLLCSGLLLSAVPILRQFLLLKELVRFSCFSGFMLTSFLYLSFSDNRLFNFLMERGPLKEIGKVSYGLYLYHTSIYHLLKIDDLTVVRTNFRLVLTLLGAVIVSIAVASLSYRLIELPFLKLKARTA